MNQSRHEQFLRDFVVGVKVSSQPLCDRRSLPCEVFGATCVPASVCASDAVLVAAVRLAA